MAKSSEFSELVRGASINQLGQLFDLDRRTVTDRLRGVNPNGRRNSFPIYRISEVAELLVSGYMSGEELTEAQKRKNAEKEKDYWDARLKEQKFLENQGDLWRTDKVIEIFADVFKYFRESVVQFADNLEHESGLPTNVIMKAKSFSDGLLLEMRTKLLAIETREEEEDFSDGDEKFDGLDFDDLEELGLL